jgi:hypothetical protein
MLWGKAEAITSCELCSTLKRSWAPARSIPSPAGMLEPAHTATLIASEYLIKNPDG